MGKICGSRQKQFTKWRKSGGGEGAGAGEVRDFSIASDTKTIICSVSNADWCTANQQASYFGKNTTQLYCRAWWHMAWNISFFKSGQLSQLCLKLLPTFILLPVRGDREALDSVRVLLTNKTLVCCQHCFSHKVKTASYRLLWRKLTSSWLDSIQFFILLCFNPGWQIHTMQPLTHFPFGGIKGRIWRANLRKKNLIVLKI